ncbi:MAG: AAA family ATPase [Thermomicrobiales bacterium]
MCAATPERLSSSLPAPRTRLVGREAEIAAASAFLLEAAVPLLTLTGPGGVGKTHLSLAIAQHVVSAFADGVVWVDLASLSDPNHVQTAITTAIGSTSYDDGQPMDQLTATLHAQQCLLLLDNCEHVLAVTAEIVQTLLKRCPAVQVLTTSRAPLRLRGEQVLEVSPLAVPGRDAPSGDEVAASASGHLFVERARAVRPSFTLGDDNAAAVATLCRRLDGLPLAIELAAARANVLSPEALVLSLDGSWSVLDHALRDLPPRQQTLEATLSWSYALLDNATQVMFRRLAVFLGGFTLEAAQALRPGHQSIQDSVVSFTTLVDYNLVSRLGGDGVPRFTMLETIRAFARERLEAAGEDADVQDAHATYILGLVDQFHPYLAAAPEPIDWTAKRMEIGDGNFRAALTRLAATGRAEAALHLAIALACAWESGVTPHEGRSWLEWSLAQSPETDSAARGHALAALAQMYWLQGRYTQAVRLADVSLAIAERLAAPGLVADATYVAGNIALSQHDFPRARILMAAAAQYWKQLGNRILEGQALQVLAGAEHGLGEDAAAMQHVAEALTLLRTVGKGWETGALARLGRITRDLGDDHAAAAAYREMLPLCQASGSRFGLVQAFAGLGEIASRRGQADIAAVLIGVIDGLVREAGAERIPAAQVNFDRAVTTAGAALGAASFSELRQAGQRLRWDEAIALAGMVTTHPGSGVGPTEPGMANAAVVAAMGTGANLPNLAGRLRPDVAPSRQSTSPTASRMCWRCSASA